MTMAVISVFLFSLRFAWLMIDPKKLQQKWVKIAPHIVDTLLLGLGVALAIKLSINPAEQPWLLEKLVAVVAYIFTGYYTLKIASSRFTQIMGYAVGMGWIVLIVYLAIAKTSLFFS